MSKKITPISLTALVKSMGKTKTFLLVLVFSLPLLTSFSKPVDDKFRVIKVIGSILIKATGSVLQQGDIINSTETIIFRSADAKASVISEKRGRFIITQSTNLNEVSLKNNLLPAMNNISSRSGPINNKIDLQNYFKGDHLVLDRVSVYINPKVFPMTEKSFFFIRYKHQNENIDKKLSFSSDTLMIQKDQLLTIDNKAIAIPDKLQCELYYYTEAGAVLISDFQLVFPGHAALKNELNTLLQEMKSKDQKEKFNEITSYLTEFYGKPDTENLNQWLKSNLAFK